MKIFLNNNEIKYLCKLLNIEAKDLVFFENDSIKAITLNSETEAGLIWKNAIIKESGVIKPGENIKAIFKLWLDYQKSIRLLTDKSVSLQAVMDDDNVLLFSKKNNDYVFEFEPASKLVYDNAVKAVALLEDLNGQDSFIITISLDEANRCFAEIAKSKTALIDKIAKSTGIDTNELLNVFKALDDKEAKQQSVFTELKVEKLNGLIKIAQIDNCYVTIKIITGDNQNRAIIAKGSTYYVLNSIYNF